MKNFKTVDPRLVTILLIVFVQMLGAAMILPILPLYASRQFNMSPQVITLLVSSFFAAQFLAGPILGRMSDRYGRVPILIISQIGTALSFFMLALAPNAAVLFLARLLDGITGGNIVVAQAYVADITPREKRTEALGYIFAVFGLGFVIGPALGGLLSSSLGPRIPYIIAGVAALIPTLLTWLVLDESVTPEQKAAAASGGTGRRSLSFSEVIQNQPLILVLLVGFVGQFGIGMLQATFALYGEAVLFAGYPPEIVDRGIGLLLAVVGFGQLLTQLVLLRRMMVRFGDAGLVIVGTSTRALAFFIFAVALSPWLGAAASLIFAIGTGLMMPSLQSIATITVDDSSRGGVLGVYQGSISLAVIFSTAIAGLIFNISPTAPYWIGVVFSLLALLPALLLLRQIRLAKVEVHAPAAH